MIDLRKTQMDRLAQLMGNDNKAEKTGSSSPDRYGDAHILEQDLNLTLEPMG